MCVTYIHTYHFELWHRPTQRPLLAVHKSIWRRQKKHKTQESDTNCYTRDTRRSSKKTKQKKKNRKKKKQRNKKKKEEKQKKKPESASKLSFLIKQLSKFSLFAVVVGGVVVEELGGNQGPEVVGIHAETGGNEGRSNLLFSLSHTETRTQEQGAAVHIQLSGCVIVVVEWCRCYRGVL